jgi:hypothetical protein
MADHDRFEQAEVLVLVHDDERIRGDLVRVCVEILAMASSPAGRVDRAHQ